MKKLFAIFPVLSLLSITLTACSSGGSSDSNATNTPAANNAEQAGS